MRYAHSRSNSPSLTCKGLSGYAFGPLSLKSAEVEYMDVEKGHDTFQISKKVTRIYYVLSGTGYFIINDQRYDASPGLLVEVPPKVEYSYSGKMKLLVFSTPRWFRGNDTTTRWNPDVVGRESASVIARDSWLGRLGRMRLFGKSPARAYLRLNEHVWNALPLSVASLRPVLAYGRLLHKLCHLKRNRRQALATFFLRNRPELELIRRLADRKSKNERLRMAVLGCSAGAEAYSIAWTIKSARPDLSLAMHAVDIDSGALEFAKRGVYSIQPSEVTGSAVLERMTPAEIEACFDRDGDAMSVQAWVREGIEWHVGDARENTLDAPGTQDIVVANNFLCHMEPPDAESCLRNIVRLVRPEGYLFVGGIDLDVRTKVARDLGWKPVRELLEEIHDGDPCLRQAWPCDYTGLEPMDKSREDWEIRYAAAFQVNQAAVQPGRNEGVSNMQTWKGDAERLPPAAPSCCST